MLQEKVTDTRLAWEKGDLSPERLTVELSRGTLEEMARFVEQVHEASNEKTYNDLEFRTRSRRLDKVAAEMGNLDKDWLDRGPGVVVLQNILPKEYDFSGWKAEDMVVHGKETARWKRHKLKLKAALAALSHNLGYLQWQGEKDPEEGERRVLVKEIKDRGMSYGQGSNVHYSDTNQGGDYHTDGAERPDPIPKYLPLLCIHQSEAGGETILKSIYPAHNRLLQKSPRLLERLYRDFIWDRRGSQSPDEPETCQKPVFSYREGRLKFSYLREYIQCGYRLRNLELNGEEKAALDAMDREIADESSYLRVFLKPGQLLVSNNYMTIHGRPKEGFRDSSTDPKRQRLMIRTWVSEVGEP